MSTSADKILGLPSHWARRLLVLSLIVNFLIVGTVVGLGMRSNEKEKALGGAFTRMVSVIGEERREPFRKIMRPRWREQTRIRKQRTEDWREIAKLVGATDFSAYALEERLIANADAHNDARRANFGPLVEALASLTPEERTKVAARVRDYVERREARER